MSATVAPSAAPENAILVWADQRYIYAELPVPPTADPCVLSFNRSSIGLSKMVNLIFCVADYSGEQIDPLKIRKLIGFEDQHGAAEAALRRYKVIK